jgi:hypothetical protein
MPNGSSNRVMQGTWDWRSSPGVKPAGQAGGLRRGALIQALVMGIVGGIVHFGFHHLLVARIIWALAGIILLLGLLFPSAYKPVHAFGQWLGRIVGTVLTTLLLVPFFFLFFTPVAFFLRWQGRDPLHRSSLDPQWTYWIARAEKDPAENIDRQFLREDREARGRLRSVGTMPSREGRDSS